MSIKIYAELLILTSFHKWSYSNDETTNFKSSAFTLDQMYLNTDLTTEQRELKKACLFNISKGFELSERKLDNAINDLNQEISENGFDPLPFSEDAIIKASKVLPETRILPSVLCVDILWSQPLIWRMLGIFNQSQYLTVAAFYARSENMIANKTFKNYYKAMMGRPLTHALHQVSQHSKPFREAIGTLDKALGGAYAKRT